MRCILRSETHAGCVGKTMILTACARLQPVKQARENNTELNDNHAPIGLRSTRVVNAHFPRLPCPAAP